MPGVCALHTLAWTGSGGPIVWLSSCPVVRYKNDNDTHSVYVRTSAIPNSMNPHTYFTHTWNETNNQLNIDFALYDSLDKIDNTSEAWTKCNYGDPDVGYPRDCGKTSLVGHQWFSMPGGRFNKRTPGNSTFEIYRPIGEPCPSEFGRPYKQCIKKNHPTVDQVKLLNRVDKDESNTIVLNFQVWANHLAGRSIRASINTANTTQIRSGCSGYLEPTANNRRYKFKLTPTQQAKCMVPDGRKHWIYVEATHRGQYENCEGVGRDTTSGQGGSFDVEITREETFDYTIKVDDAAMFTFTNDHLNIVLAFPEPTLKWIRPNDEVVDEYEAVWLRFTVPEPACIAAKNKKWQLTIVDDHITPLHGQFQVVDDSSQVTTHRGACSIDYQCSGLRHTKRTPQSHEVSFRVQFRLEDAPPVSRRLAEVEPWRATHSYANSVYGNYGFTLRPHDDHRHGYYNGYYNDYYNSGGWAWIWVMLLFVACIGLAVCYWNPRRSSSSNSAARMALVSSDSSRFTFTPSVHSSKVV